MKKISLTWVRFTARSRNWDSAEPTLALSEQRFASFRNASIFWLLLRVHFIGSECFNWNRELDNVENRFLHDTLPQTVHNLPRLVLTGTLGHGHAGWDSQTLLYWLDSHLVCNSNSHRFVFYKLSNYFLTNSVKYITPSKKINNTIGDGGITVDFWIIKVHTSNWSSNSWGYHRIAGIIE